MNDRSGGDSRGLAGVCVGFALVILDANVLNVAVPVLQLQLRATDDELLWAVDAYTVAFAALLLSTGVLGDRWGARRAFLAGLTVFALGSLGCALAPAVEWLIAGRVVQGTGAALLAPTSLALIHRMYPEGPARVSAVAVWASISGVAFAAGPLVGGLLIEATGWPSVFWINLPVGLAAAVLVARHVGRSPTGAARSSVLGQVLAVVALSALTAALIEAGRSGGGAVTTLVPSVLFLAAAAAFVIRERRGARPLVPRAAVRSPPVRAGLLAGAAFNFAMYGSLFVYTLHLQQGRGYSPVLTGLAFLPLTLLHTPVATWLAGPWTSGRGPRGPLTAGLACTVAGSAGFAVAATQDYWALGVALGVFGVGSGLITTSMTSLVLANVPGEGVGVSCGLLNAARQLGGALGVAALGSIVAGGGADGRIAVAGVCAALAVGVALVVTATYRVPAPIGGR